MPLRLRRRSRAPRRGGRGRRRGSRRRRRGLSGRMCLMRRGLDRKARLVWGDRIRLESGARPAGRGRDGRCRRGWRRRDRPGMRPVLRGRPRRRLRGASPVPCVGSESPDPRAAAFARGRASGFEPSASGAPANRSAPGLSGSAGDSASDPSIRGSGPFVPGEDSLAPGPGPFAPDSGPSEPGAASARETPMEMSRVSSSRRTASGLEASISCAGRKRNVRPSARRMSSHSPSALMKAPLSSGCAAATSTAQSMKAMCSLSPEKPAFRTSVHRRRDGCRADRPRSHWHCRCRRNILGGERCSRDLLQRRVP